MSKNMGIGLECKASWCDKLLSGEKSVELRTYPLPEEYLGQRIWLLASGGQDGVASLGDVVSAGSDAAMVVGWVTFSAVRTYRAWEEWQAHAQLHCVPADSPYAFQKGSSAEVFGWVVEATGRLRQPRSGLPDMTRLKRSLFRMHSCPDDD